MVPDNYLGGRQDLPRRTKTDVTQQRTGRYQISGVIELMLQDAGERRAFH
jgi:hypothetical protein